MRSLPVALLLLVFLVFQASARTWHIKPDGTGDAPTIQAGVDSAAAGDSVLLAAGTYHDCTHVGPSNVKHCVIMKTGVVLRSETGQAAGVTIDARGQGRGILCNAVSGGAAIEYLTITGGSASTGGGMYCNGGAVALTGLLFSGNTSSEIGGGLYILGAQTWPAIMECVFAGNTSPDGGGAMVYGSDQKVTFTRCVFSYNYGGMGGGAGVRGGLAWERKCDARPMYPDRQQDRWFFRRRS